MSLSNRSGSTCSSGRNWPRPGAAAVSPPIPSFTTDTCCPKAAWSRRDIQSRKRSLLPGVVIDPSTDELPAPTRTRVSAGASTSTASTKKKDEVSNGNASSPSSSVWSPLPGEPRNDSCSAVPWKVIGPLCPGMNIETARLRPSTAGSRREKSPVSWTKRTRTASLNTSWPAGTVTDCDPPKVTTVFVPATVAPEKECRPIAIRPKVTGPTPKAFERRMRIVSPQMSGFTIIRSVWLFACGRAGATKGKAKFASAGAFTPRNTSCGAVVQLAAHLRSSRCFAAGASEAHATQSTSAHLVIWNLPAMPVSFAAFQRGPDESAPRFLPIDRSRGTRSRERRPCVPSVAAGRSRGGRHVLRAALAHRQRAPVGRRAWPASWGGRRRRPQRKDRLLRGRRIPRQDLGGEDDDGRHLQHRVDDEADGGRDDAHADRGRCAHPRRSSLEVPAAVRADEGGAAEPRG